jgi:hypothetical protein
VGRSEPGARHEAVLEGAGDAVGEEDGGEADSVIYHSANLPQPSDLEESDFGFRISDFGIARIRFIQVGRTTGRF